MGAGAGEGEPGGALRPLRSAAAAVAVLRAASAPSEEARAAVIQVAAAVESSLRRLLRDLPRAALEVRLRALAPDELREDEALAELRQHQRITLELAAAVHDLFETRQRLRRGEAMEARDAALAVSVADRLEHEVHYPPASPGEEMPAPVAEETHPETAPVPSRVPAGARRWRWAGAAALVLLLGGLGIWLFAPRDRGQLEQGIALFRSGDYASAASYFWRYKERHPDDPTPRLYLARIHRRMGRVQLAAPELKAALDLAPRDPDVHEELGFLLLDTGHPEEAVTRFRAALGLDPESREGWLGLVRALQAAGRPDAAQRVLERAPERVRELLKARTGTGTASQLPAASGPGTPSAPGP